MTIRIEWDADRCRQHGQCEIAAPELFRLDVDGTLHVAADVAPGLRDDAWAAADACPEQAITIIESEDQA
jgi:ferredoxin